MKAIICWMEMLDSLSIMRKVCCQNNLLECKFWENSSAVSRIRKKKPFIKFSSLEVYAFVLSLISSAFDRLLLPYNFWSFNSLSCHLHFLAVAERRRTRRTKSNSSNLNRPHNRQATSANSSLHSLVILLSVFALSVTDLRIIK